MTTSIDRYKLGALGLILGLGLLGSLAVRDGRAAGDAGATASAVKTVAIKGFAFKPKALTINRGSRVTFANRDSVPHTATKGNSFDTKRIAPGRSVTVKFKRRGSFAYHCKIHTFMEGKIVVE